MGSIGCARDKRFGLSKLARFGSLRSLVPRLVRQRRVSAPRLQSTELLVLCLLPVCGRIPLENGSKGAFKLRIVIELAAVESRVPSILEDAVGVHYFARLGVLFIVGEATHRSVQDKARLIPTLVGAPMTILAKALE